MAKQELAVIEANLNALDKIASESNALSTSAKNSFAAALVYSVQVQKIEALLTPEVMAQAILPLANKEIGWREDKPGSYSIEELKNVWVSAVLRGALPVNDEVLVISKRMYLQKNHFRRKVREFPGLTDLVLLPGKISLLPNGALAEMTATWKLNGREQKIERVGASAIPIRLNAGQGADAAIGKAERKILASIYTQLTGSEVGDEDPEDMSDLVPAKAKEIEVSAVVERSKLQSGTESIKAVLREKERAKPVVVAKEDGVTPWSDPESDTPDGIDKAQAAADQKLAEDVKTAEAAAVIKKAQDAAKPTAGSKKVGVGRPKDEVVVAAKTTVQETTEIQNKDESVVDQDVRLIASIKKRPGVGDEIASFRVTADNTDQYYIKGGDIKLATRLLKEFQEKKASVLISYTTNASGERWICDIDTPAEPEKSDDQFDVAVESDSQ